MQIDVQDPIISNYLKSLNTAQLEAVENIDGPLLILAGAGTGKTKVLTTRMAHIILSRKAYPSQILSVTFTNKAAREMRERITNLVEAEGIWLGTFHSIAAKILRRHAELVGLSSNYNIIDTDDQIRLLKNIISSSNIDEKKYPPKLLLAIIQKWKDLGLTPDKISENDLGSAAHYIAKQAYFEYQKRLLSIGAVDFGDLLLLNIQLFTNHPDLLTSYQYKFRYILVDEYQDTNIAQYIWLRMLAQGHKNICCVGDEDQSIYGWRGAEIGNILRFEQDFPGAKVIRLEQNYRSTNYILSVASKVISNNTMRLGKVLWTDFSEGSKVKLAGLIDDREEARYIAGEIMSLKRNEDAKLSEMAILVRAGFQTRAFEECFMSYGLNYKVIGGFKFYERLEIRDVIAYIRVALQPDDDLALERIINTPKRAIGDATVKQLYNYAHIHNISLFKAIENMIKSEELKTRVKTPLKSLVESFNKWHELYDIKNHVEVVEIILKESGYLAMWQQDKSIEAEGRIENIKELLRALEEFNNISEFLEHVSLVTDVDLSDQENMVNIMTLHAAKGLEFNNVFLPGWEEGIFPHQRALDESGNNGLEEERRLAYVGITRAKRELHISYTTYRRVYNQFQNQMPSRFIAELPLDSIEQIDFKRY
jgi:DNA helicase-2/ATP-dependent DNA helicase PcrA